MSKYIPVILGAYEIVAGIALEIITGGAATPLAVMLIASGAGMVISGIGTLLSQGPVNGTSTASRNPIAPWNVVYGRAKLGGTMVFLNEFGENNKYIDMVFVLACHACQSFDALLLDGQRVRLDGNGCSFTPTQQTVSILSISRTNDVVTVQTSGAVTDLQTGDSLQIKNVSGSLDSDKAFNGIFPVTVVDATHFTYINGGPKRTLTGIGQATTLWPNYKAKIHAEWLLGNHTATFPGMLNGTPYDGDPGNLVTNSSNPWTAQHLLLGRTAVFLRLHYNDEIFANGLPTIAFRISGKNDIYDPRSVGTWFQIATEVPGQLMTLPVGTVWRMGYAPNDSWSANQTVTGSPLTISTSWLEEGGLFPDPAPGKVKEIDVLQRPTAQVVQIGSSNITVPAAHTVLGRSTTLLNGWGNNAHVGAYEEGVDQGYGWGLNNDTTYQYANPGSAADTDLTTAASVTIRGSHRYAGCVWQFASIETSPASPPNALWLNILSAVNPFTQTGRSAGIWYSLDNGTTWVEIYNTPDHPKGWDSIALDPSTDTSHIQVMAFTDAHDDMAHYVYDIQLATGPGSSNPDGTGYTENAALCIADYLCQKTWGFKCNYGSDVPLDPLIAAANICDELVPLAAGGTEKRYLCNGGFPLTMKRGEVLQNLLTSCGGRITYQNGQYIIWPAAWLGVGFPDAPIPAGPGESVAWSFATEWPSPGQFSIPPTIWNAELGCSGSSGGTQKTGFIGVSNGDSLDTPSGLAISWGGFALPQEIPAGAAITHVHPVVTVSAIQPGGFIGLGSSPSSILAPASPPAGTYVGTDVGTLTGLTIGAEAFNSVPGPGSIGIGISFVGVAVYYETPTDTIPIQPFPGSADILPILGGPFRWRQKVSIRDQYNGVKGTYVSPVNGWQASDIPPYAQDIDHGYMSGGSPMYPFGDANLFADGGERRWFDIQLPFTISCPCAQRLCKVELLRRRQQGTGTFLFNLAMYKATVLDIVAMTFPVLNFVGKLLEIQAHRFTLTKQQNAGGDEVMALATEIDVQETDPSVYAWSPSEELQAQGFQQQTSGSGGGTAGGWWAYQNDPPYSLSQPSATEIDIAAVTVTFANGQVASYNARTLTIAAPTVNTWYYVYINDPDLLGDIPGATPVAFAETTTTNVGTTGNVYMGAIEALPNGGAIVVLPGGWPAPTSFQVIP